MISLYKDLKKVGDLGFRDHGEPKVNLFQNIRIGIILPQKVKGYVLYF